MLSYAFIGSQRAPNPALKVATTKAPTGSVLYGVDGSKLSKNKQYGVRECERVCERATSARGSVCKRPCVCVCESVSVRVCVCVCVRVCCSSHLIISDVDVFQNDIIYYILILTVQPPSLPPATASLPPSRASLSHALALSLSRSRSGTPFECRKLSD